jgi:hypothetical protein
MYIFLIKLNYYILLYMRMEDGIYIDIINKLDENNNIIVTKIKKTYENGILIKQEYYEDDKLQINKPDY